MEIDETVMKKEEHNSFAAEPAVYANRYYVGTLGNNTFKVVFAEEDGSTRQSYMRFAALIPLEGIFGLMNALQEALKNQQVITEKMKAEYDANQAAMAAGSPIDRNRATDLS